MAVLIDTDVLIGLERGVARDELERAIGEEDRAISVVTVSELLHGVHRATGAQRAHRSAFVEHLLAGMQALDINEQIARVHAGVWAELAATGNMLGAHDLWIAATALAHGMRLVTGKSGEFRRVPGLRLIDQPV
jgi:predicted nucleic acid-binding protein